MEGRKVYPPTPHLPPPPPRHYLLIILLYPKAKQGASTLFSTLLPRPSIFSGT